MPLVSGQQTWRKGTHLATVIPGLDFLVRQRLDQSMQQIVVAADNCAGSKSCQHNGMRTIEQASAQEVLVLFVQPAIIASTVGLEKGD